MKALAQYIGTLQHSGGDCDGQPFTVLPWQRRFIDLAFRSPKPTALSIARGNGKSCLVAAIASATVDPAGPLTGRRRETVVAASSFAQARIIFEDTLAFLREAGHDLKARALWRLQDSQNAATVECLGTGARVRCIGSDPKRAHGLRPALALLDEPAQWEPTRRDAMLAAIRTGLGKVPGSRLISLGTRPASGTHWFGQMLAGDNSQCHAASPDDPPFQRRTWRKANPSLPILPSLEAKLREEAALARRDPEMLAAFKALRLNQGTADTEQSHLIS
ncbi:MAG: hypothetical protein OXD30_00165, partial [Bryobacterales bacterium]|nr:hypothetical protein [Bryobacterales bacterium]